MGTDSIRIRQCELESILVNHRHEYESNELANMEEEMFQIHHIYDLWLAFGEVPMNPETECIETEWNGFLAGTHREEIWHWFEDTFDLSVAEDLMGL